MKYNNWFTIISLFMVALITVGANIAYAHSSGYGHSWGHGGGYPNSTTNSTTTVNTTTTTAPTTTVPATTTIQSNPPTISLKASNPNIKNGELETFTITICVYGKTGTTPLTVELYNITGGRQQGSSVTIPATGGTNTISFKVSNPGKFTYNAIATGTNACGCSYTISSPNQTITVTGSKNGTNSTSNTPGTNTLTISLAASNTVLTAGQSETLTATSTGGGTSNTYTFYTVSTTNTPITTCNSIVGTSSATCTFNTIVGTFSYGAGVVSGSQSANSAPISVTVNNAVTTNTPTNTMSGNTPTLTITPSNSAIQSNQLETYTLTVNNGIGPFDVELFNITGGRQQGMNAIIASPGGSANIIFETSNTGTFTFNGIATDEASNFVFASNPSTIVVSSNSPSSNSPGGNTISNTPTPNTPTITLTPSATTLQTGQAETFTVNVLGGSGPYTIELFNVTNSLPQGGISNVVIPTSSGTNTITLTSGATGSFTFNAIATDLGTNTPTVFSSSPVTITVTTPTNGGGATGGGGTTGGGGASGSIGGGGGGSSGGLPPQMNPQVSTSGECVKISDVGPNASFTFTFGSMVYRATDNYITSSSTGVTVDGSQYVLQLNGNLTMLSGSSVYMELTNVTSLPPVQYVTLLACPAKSVNTTVITSINVTANQDANSITITKVQPANYTGLVKITSTSAVPVLPKDYTGIFAANLSVNSPTVTNVNFTVNYECGISANSLQPFLVAGSAWVAVPSFTVNANDCTISYNMPPNRVTGLLTTFSSLPPQKPTGNTTTPQVIVVPTTPGKTPFPWWIVVVSGGLISVLSFGWHKTLATKAVKTAAKAVKK
jgi:hypothetical protein